MVEPRPCSVCSHPDRLSIEQALVSGKGLRPVARDFGIGSGKQGTTGFRPDHKKVERHRDRCMAESYQAAVQERTLESGNALVSRMAELDAAVDESLARLRAGMPVKDENGPMLDEDGNVLRHYAEGTLLAAVREARRNVEMRARLAGSLPEAAQGDVDAARAALNDAEARRLVVELENHLATQARP